jgi:CubicO group peptidase (beta-lactamase class C family)
MKRIAGLVLLVVACAVQAGEQWQPAGVAADDDPRVVAGFRALFTCSAHFVAGRPLSDIKVVELAGVGGADWPDPVIDEDARIVAASDPQAAIEALAAYRESLGCSLLPPEWTRADAGRLPAIAEAGAAPDLSGVPFPDGDGDSLPPDGIDPRHAALARVVDRAFEGDAFSSGRGAITLAVVVLRDGRLVAERYRPGFGIHSGYRTWSTTKTISAALIGIAQRKGILDVDAPADIPEWDAPDDPRRAITYRHLLWMSSGLVSGGSNANAVYFGGQDVISAVTTTALEAAPGTRWKYANNDTLLLLRALRHRLADDAAYLRFPYDELLRPIGMHHTRMETDHRGNFVGSSQTYTTARDLARFGLLLARDGVWNGRRLLPEGWVAFMTTPAPAYRRAPGEMDYGAQVWLLSGFPGVPAGSYTTAGRRGQYVSVVPAFGLVIVRTGVDQAGASWRQEQLVAHVVAAIKRSQPDTGAVAAAGLEWPSVASGGRGRK